MMDLSHKLENLIKNLFNEKIDALEISKKFKLENSAKKYVELYLNLFIYN